MLMSYIKIWFFLPQFALQYLTEKTKKLGVGGNVFSPG